MQRDSLFIGLDTDDVLCCLEKVGGGDNLGEVEVLWEKLNRVCVPGGCSGGNVAVLTTVMVEGGANVPTINSICED